MYEWQLTLAVELFVVLAGFYLLLRAANAEQGPRLFTQVVAVIVIIVATLLAGFTSAVTVIEAVKKKPAPVTTQPAPIIIEREVPPRLTPTTPTAGTAKAKGYKEPKTEWEGDLLKEKKFEEGELLKKKWSERDGG